MQKESLEEMSWNELRSFGKKVLGTVKGHTRNSLIDAIKSNESWNEEFDKESKSSGNEPESETENEEQKIAKRLFQRLDRAINPGVTERESALPYAIMVVGDLGSM